jgi:hypothetical protein
MSSRRYTDPSREGRLPSAKGPAHPSLSAINESFQPDIGGLQAMKEVSGARQRISTVRTRINSNKAKDLVRAYEARGRTFRLADAQWVIAREHGFENWTTFASEVRRLAARASESGGAPPSRTAIFAVDLDIKTDEVNTCAFTRGGRRAITGAHGNPVRVWDVETGRSILSLDDRTVAAWAPPER